MKYAGNIRREPKLSARWQQRCGLSLSALQQLVILNIATFILNLRVIRTTRPVFQPDVMHVSFLILILCTFKFIAARLVLLRSVSVVRKVNGRKTSLNIKLPALSILYVHKKVKVPRTRLPSVGFRS